MNRGAIEDAEQAIPTSRPRWPGGRLDAAGAGLVVTSLAIYSAHGFHGFIERDLSLYVYAGQRFADGVVPYDGVINRSGPLSHVFPGIGIWVGRLFGGDDIISARVFFMLLSVLAVWLTYRLALKAFGSRGIALAAGTGLLALGGFTQYAADGPREKTVMVVFLLLSMLAMAEHSWWWAGIWLSLSTLTWQPVLFAGLAGALVGVLLESRGQRLRSLVRFSVGGLVPLAAFLAMYAAIGKLQLFLDCFVLIHVRYTEQPTMVDHWDATWKLLLIGFAGTVWVFLVGLAAIVALAGVALAVPSRRRSEQGRQVIIAGAVAVGGVVWSLRAFNGWPDIFMILPPAMFGLAAVLAETRRLARPRLTVAAVAAVVVTTLVIGTVFTITRRNTDLDRQRARALAVSELVGPDATFWSLQGPGALVLTDHVNPVRHQMFGLGLADYVDDTWPGGLAGLAKLIDQERPEVISMGYMSGKEWVLPTLQADYVKVGSDVGFEWWVSRDLDPALREQIREAVAAGRPAPR